MVPLRLGVVGLGHIHESQAEALQLVKGIDWTAAFDIDPERQPEATSVERFPSLTKLLDSSIDAILIATPPATHEEIALECLNVGKDVLLEKPAALSTHSLERLYSATDERAALLVVAYHAAFARDVTWWVNQNSATHGAILAAKSEFYDPYLVDGEVAAHAVALGDSWLDSGVNALSVLTRLVELVSVAEARHTIVPSAFAKSLHSSIDLVIRDRDRQGLANVETNWCLGLDRKRTTLLYESGVRVVLDHSEQAVRARYPDGRVEMLAALARRERLVEHYIGVFDDFRERVEHRLDNRATSRLIHRLLLDEAYSGFSNA